MVLTWFSCRSPTNRDGEWPSTEVSLRHLNGWWTFAWLGFDQFCMSSCVFSRWWNHISSALKMCQELFDRLLLGETFKRTRTMFFHQKSCYHFKACFMQIWTVWSVWSTINVCVQVCGPGWVEQYWWENVMDKYVLAFSMLHVAYTSKSASSCIFRVR